MHAFHIFVDIYVQKYPNEAAALMKYANVIQGLAAKGHNWKYYDEHFRFLRQTQSTSLPWGNVHWELWLLSQQTPYQRTAQSSGKTNRFVAIPKGFCYKYHKGNECAGCNFKHTCFKCDGQHRASQCNFRGPHVNPSSPAPRLPSPPLPTPIRVHTLCLLFSGYIRSTVEFLRSGFTDGFPLHYEGDHVSFETTNLKSALEHPEVVDAKIKKELDAHRLAGPFHFPPFPIFHVSPIRVVPKKSRGEFRLIHHLFLSERYIN